MIIDPDQYNMPCTMVQTKVARAILWLLTSRFTVLTGNTIINNTLNAVVVELLFSAAWNIALSK